MLNAKCTRIETGDKESLFVIDMKGHATGSVAICNAAGALVQSLCYWLRENGSEVLSMKISPGDCVVRFVGGEREKAVFDMVRLGLIGLEQKNNELVRVDCYDG